MQASVRRAAGKTRIASRLRDAEVAAGGEPPRIHSIDDYFVTARPPCASWYAWLMRMLAVCVVWLMRMLAVCRKYWSDFCHSVCEVLCSTV